MPTISIICPVYNTAKCIDKCIKSVYSQSFEDWELILINDCSTDNSVQILKKWKNIDNNRIQLINHEINKGVDQARFTGLDKAAGKYIMFIDSDDWLAKDSLKKLYEKIEAEKSDIVYGSIVNVLDPLGIIRKRSGNSYLGVLKDNIVNPELFNDYFISYFGVNKLTVAMFGKLYKLDTIKRANLCPSYAKMGEDLLFNLKLHPFLEKVSFIEDVVYYYRLGGMTSGPNPTFLDDIKKQYRLKEHMIEKHEYYKAIPYIKYELINCFYSHFKARILFDKLKYKDFKNKVLNELEDAVYTEAVTDIDLKIKHIAIRNKNINEIYKIIQEIIRSEKIKTWLKIFISSFFR